MNFKVLTLIVVFAHFSSCEEEELNEIEEELNEIEELTEIDEENPFSGTGRIVGGQIVRIDSVPYLTSISRKGNQHCDASIISNKWLLSAAHCFADTNPTNYKVRTGSSRATKYGKVFEVAKIINHPLYDIIPSDFDFTLLQIKGSITFNDKQQIIKLADANKGISEPMEVIVSGFGNTQNALESTEFLRGVVVNVTNQQECNDSWNGGITSNMFCAGSTGRDSCQGDSG